MTPQNNNEAGPQITGHTQTDSSSGTTEVKTPDELALENFNKHTQVQAPKEDKKPDETKVETTEPNQNTQQTEKDRRHFDRIVQKNIQSKIQLAKKLVEKDRDEIYSIADEDPDLADHLLKEFDFGANSVDELLSIKELGNVQSDETTVLLKKDQLRTSREIDNLKKKLLDSEVTRLRESHPDLEGDVEEKFRELVQRPDFESVETDRVLDVARALTGKPRPTQSKTNDVANELLNAVQGSISTSGGGSTQEGDHRDANFRKVMSAMNISPQALKEYEAEYGKL